MSKHKRSFLIPLLAALVSLAFPALAEQSPHPVDPSVAILFTNDIHSYYDRDIGYDGLKLLREEMEQKYAHVLLVDAGDAIQGSPIGALSKGVEPVRMMNQTGYDIAILGNHEFDFGLYALVELQDQLNCGYICANFCTVDGVPVFDPYRIIDLDGINIAFIGVDTPYSFSNTSIHTMMDDLGIPMYDFKLDKSGEALYACLQACIDEVREEGADHVILVGHLGDGSDIFSSSVVISHLKGLDAFIDGHSHLGYNITVPDAEGKAVPLAQTGSYFANVGRMILGPDGSIDIDIISEIPAPETWMEGIEAIEITRGGRTRWVDKDTHEFLEAITDSYNSVMSRPIGTSAYDLELHDEDSARSSRRHENGLCELVADAYREFAEADISIINAASVRNSLPAGAISFNTILDVLPYSNNIMTARLSGQTILDVLEFGCREIPQTCAGFPQVSGLEFTVDATIESSVITDEKGDFIGVGGTRRVRDVFIGGEPINPERLYTMATNSYLLDGGDNFKMLAEDAEIIGTTEEADNIVLADYIIYNLDGAIPASYLQENRIHEVAEASVP